jgi:hypothetical protein
MQKGKKLLFWMLVALLGANFVVPTWTFCAAFFILATGSV